MLTSRQNSGVARSRKKRVCSTKKIGSVITDSRRLPDASRMTRWNNRFNSNNCPPSASASERGIASDRLLICVEVRN